MRKGQAAMEFLMTYGWAILVVLVAIGALAYFGVLSPGQFLPKSCIIGPGFSCADFKVTATTGGWEIIVMNGIGESINTVDLVLNDITPNPPTTSDGSCATDPIPAGGKSSCTGTMATGTAGDRVKATISFKYTGSGGLSHTVTGTLTTEME